jgi:hypothetical protein
MADDTVRDQRGELSRRAALGLMAVPMAAAALHATAADAKETPGLDLSKPAWPNGRIYIHETLNLTVRDRKAYLDLFGTWPEAGRKVGSPLRCVGIWGTLGNSHNWAEAVILWELKDLEQISDWMQGAWDFMRAPNAKVPDMYAAFWGEGKVKDDNGQDRMLAATPHTRSMDQLFADKVKGSGYLQQEIFCRPGEIDDHLERVDTQFKPVAERLGILHVGSYRTLLLNNNHGFVFWALPKWQSWAAYEQGLRTDREARAWLADCAARGVTWDAKLMNGAARNPLDLGHEI